MKKHIPNIITCCNLLSGCIAIAYAFGGSPVWALTWIIIGAIFDFFDGMSARLLNVSSPIGKELDSLADDVTFGVAPATLVFYELGVVNYPPFLESLRDILPFFAYLIAAFSALRLAKFNLDERQTTSFIGLPTPANALFWGSLVVCSPGWLENYPWSIAVWLVLICLSCYLLICELPMFALKFKHWGWQGNEIKYGFVAISVIVFLSSIILSGAQGLLEAWWPIISLYLLVSICDFMKKKTSRQ